MPSVGFTLSKLRDGLDPESPDLIRKWQLNKELFDSFFGFDYPLAVYKGLDEPNMIFTVGPFAEQEEHLEDFARSDEMDEYLDEFGETLDLRGAFHLERDWKEMPSTAPFVSIGRYFVIEENCAEFEDVFGEMLAGMPTGVGVEGFCSGWTLKGGWRDQVEGNDAVKLAGMRRKENPANLQSSSDAQGDELDEGTREWVIFFGWKSQEAMVESLSAIEKDMEDRDASWKPLSKIVRWCKQCTIRNYARVEYNEYVEK